jgi:hypothetical protein
MGRNSGSTDTDKGMLGFRQDTAARKGFVHFLNANDNNVAFEELAMAA